MQQFQEEWKEGRKRKLQSKEKRRMLGRMLGEEGGSEMKGRRGKNGGMKYLKTLVKKILLCFSTERRVMG